jgi:hypothetical protein
MDRIIIEEERWRDENGIMMFKTVVKMDTVNEKEAIIYQSTLPFIELEKRDSIIYEFKSWALDQYCKPKMS